MPRRFVTRANKQALEIEDVAEPFCGMYRKNMITVGDYDPILESEWCLAKNCGFGPHDFSHGSGVKVWWTCSYCELTYKAQIANRTTRESGCPYCDSKKVCDQNSLAKNFPEIAKEWHPTKNGKKAPEDFAWASGKEAFWKCARGHEWKTPISRRTFTGTGCPYCAGNLPSKERNLAKLHPELAKEWHPTLNGKLRAQDVTPASHKKVWWICDKGPDHEWQAPPHDRTTKKSGCGACAGKQVSVTNSLETKSPEIASEWHKTKNGTLKPSEVIAGSGKCVWWQCKRGHVWQQVIVYRTARNVKCPECRKLC